MPSAASSTAASNAGIETTASGERHIPSSTRADGSVRKEIKVRPGYRPPEDVEVYKNRTAEGWKNRGKGGVPGAQFVNTKAQKESKSKAKKQKETTEPSVAASSATGTKPAPQEPENEAKETEATATPVDPEEEKEKQARKLSKKLRQARDLAAKKENGESLLPEQFEKVIRINELTRQLDNLGFDADGQRKT